MTVLELQENQKKFLDGYRVKVKIDDVSLINEDIDIVFNGLKIGYIESINRLNKTPYATFFIENAYKNLVNSSSKFYYQNGVELSAGLDGIKFKMSSLSHLLKGSVALSNEHKVIDNSLMGYKYKLYKDFNSIPFKRFEFSLIADDSYDLELGSSIVYKGIEVGKVTQVKLNDDLNKVLIGAYLFEKYKKLAYGNPYYHITKPNITLDGIKGLKTLIKGSYINLVASNKGGEISNSFVLNDIAPKSSLYKKGKVFKLLTTKNIDLSSSSKVYYKKIEIGEIDKIYLSSDSTNAIVDILVYDEYRNLVRENSIFYESSGIDVDISLLGADIKADTLTTVLYGGVILYTPNEIEAIAKENREFILEKDKDTKWEEYNPTIKLN